MLFVSNGKEKKEIFEKMTIRDKTFRKSWPFGIKNFRNKNFTEL